MKKITLFFCDICGTFDTNSNINIDQNKEIKKLTNNLEKIKEKNNSDKVIFSFITADNLDSVNIEEQKLIDNACSTDIELGKHFYSKHKADINNKAMQILGYIKELEKKYIIDEIYYADDCEFYHIMLYGLKKIVNVDYFINSIIPKENGIAEVNKILENEHIKSSQKIKKGIV